MSLAVSDFEWFSRFILSRFSVCSKAEVLSAGFPVFMSVTPGGIPVTAAG